MEDPNLQKNRKIQGSDQPARAPAKARRKRKVIVQRNASGSFQRVTRGQKRVEDAHKRAYALRVHLLRKKSLRRGWIAGSSPAMTARPSSPRKRGPIITAGGYGSRLSARFRGRRPGRQELAPREAPTYGCTKSRPEQFPCFRPVFTGNRSTPTCPALPGPNGHPQFDTPYVHPH